MRTAPKPEIAVVIPTLNRESRLAFALEALAAQTLERERFEVIVVRAHEGSTRLAEAPAGLRVRFLTRPDSTGAAMQRNVGWKATEAPLVAFTDDDCRPAPGWLAGILAAAGDELTFVQGRTEPDPDERHLLYGLARTIEIAQPGHWYESCNIAYPRALLDRLGGFDERFPGAWGEDSDLGLRAREAGAERKFVHEAVVRHAVLPRSIREALRDAARYEAMPLLLSRHPGHRPVVYPRRLIKTSHATLLGAVLGSLALRRRPALAAFLWAPYLAEHLRHHLETNPLSVRGLARLALQLPIPIATELVEIAATVRGAIRHRVLVI